MRFANALRFLLGVLAVAVLPLTVAGCGADEGGQVPLASITATTPGVRIAASPSPTSRTVTDMAGREVTLPLEVGRVATSGSVPVLNSFVYALGAGDRLVSHPADRHSLPRWDFRNAFAPQLAEAPKVDLEDGTPIVEALLSLQPDVTLTFDTAAAGLLESVGLAAVVLRWQNPEDVKEVMALVGEVLGAEERAAAYIAYFDETLVRVRVLADRVPDAEKPRVLYFNPQNQSQPHLIAEWWITAAGGVSVTDDGRTTESMSFNVEQLLEWNPDVILVPQLADVARVYGDPLLAELPAVVGERVYPLPVVAHTWGNRTTEQPLTVLWAAVMLNPEAFASIDLHAEVSRFYAEIFDHPLTSDEVDSILDVTTEPPYER